MKSQRHLARIAAMQALFTILHRPGISITDSLQFVLTELPELSHSEFAKELVEGVLAYRTTIETTIQEYTLDKNMEKIDPITLSILFIGIFELMHSTNKQPPAVVINEAIELAKEYGKENAPPLINAILSKVKDSQIHAK